MFVQYYKSLHANTVPSPALVKAALINSADEMDVANGGPGPIPNNDEGWGRINLANIIVTNIALNFGDREETVEMPLPLRWRWFGWLLKRLGQTPPEPSRDGAPIPFRRSPGS